LFVTSGEVAIKPRARGERIGALRILDGALAGRPYLLGEAFTLADLNVAATLSEPHENGRIDGDLDPADHGLVALADWLNRCCTRESWERVRDMA
jgi:glutathione S-transferase